ncbi:hypothetical protein C5167_010136 [Papaver somniferum]|uniref:Uncharacterized protein n=1 Tax=Papaver somniferum TaxID=3469 RepID=A0A4Y7K0S1_PAPSO|nr:uncharacterized protein LOC113288673 [Papaver somniferum]RZC66446.1 hypothetical protein C5167_010136 [Papaver somniferum]
MPTFTAISIDSLLDRSLAPRKSILKLERRNTTPIPPTVKEIPNPKQQSQQHGVSPSPLLYTTPETTPIPDSSSSFPPSPYIVNHKRRGPRLRSVSQDHIPVSVRQNGDVDKIDVKDVTVVPEFSFASSAPVCEEEVVVVGSNGCSDDKIGSHSLVDDSVEKNENLVMNSGSNRCERDYEFDHLFDSQEPHQSMGSIGISKNVADVVVEDNGGVEQEESSVLTTPVGEFYDAYEELSSEGGASSSLRDFEAELREIRLNLLMEIEKRKQAEEAFNKMQTHWQQLQRRLAAIGLKLPADPIFTEKDKDSPSDIVADLCQQIHNARVVSNSIGRATAKAEAEMEIKSQIESKNFEIARLSDRLHYYEVVNAEMSQRNQEAIEMERRLRQRRRSRQRWGVWSSVGAAVVVGTVALLWSCDSASSSSATSVSDSPGSADT